MNVTCINRILRKPAHQYLAFVAIINFFNCGKKQNRNPIKFDTLI